jgi:hypothetical protein
LYRPNTSKNCCSENGNVTVYLSHAMCHTPGAAVTLQFVSIRRGNEGGARSADYAAAGGRQQLPEFRQLKVAPRSTRLAPDDLVPQRLGVKKTHQALTTKNLV